MEVGLPSSTEWFQLKLSRLELALHPRASAALQYRSRGEGGGPPLFIWAGPAGRAPPASHVSDDQG